MDIGRRLREERERLGLTQAELAQRAGLDRKSQINYESGEREPKADYLAFLAGVGVDVLYVITGVRSAPPGGATVLGTGDGATVLTADEAALLDNYRHSSEKGKRAVEAAAAALALPATPELGEEKAA